jgi:uncharacterized membrane protein YgcG
VVVAASEEVAPVAAGKRTTISRRQRRRVEQAVDQAEETTGLQFCVYLGPTSEDSRAHAEQLFVETGLHTRPAVLILVAPPQRRVEIVTGPAVREWASDEACARVVDQMTAHFSAGDLAGGIVTGVESLAAIVGPNRGPGGEELPDVLGE